MSFVISLILLGTIFNSPAICADVYRRSVPVTIEAETRKAENTRDVEIPFPINIVDPFEFGSLELNLPGDIFSLSLNVSGGSISGMSKFRLLELNFSKTEPKFRFNILFPSLTLHSEHYHLDGRIYNVAPLSGNGVAHIEVYNLQFWGILSMKPSETSYSILFDKLEDADFKVEKIVCRTEFDHNIDHIISAMVEDLLADYLNRFSKYLVITYSDTIIEYINEVLLMFE